MTDAEVILAAGEALDRSRMHRGGLSDRNFNFLDAMRSKLEDEIEISLSEPQRDWMDDIAGDLGVGLG